MPTNDRIQLPTDGSGKYVDTHSLTIDTFEVHREKHRLAGVLEADLADIQNAVALLTSYGLVVRQAPLPIQRLRQENTAAQTDQSMLAVGATDLFIVTAYSIWVSPKCAVDVDVAIELGTAIVVDYEKLPPGTYLKEQSPLGLIRGADNDDLLLTNTVPTDGSVVVHVSGYIE